MRRLSKATWIAIIVTGLLVMLGSMTGNIGAAALTWLSPQAAGTLYTHFIIPHWILPLARTTESYFQTIGSRRTRKPSDYTEPSPEYVDYRFSENPIYYSYDEQLLSLPLHRRVGSRYDLVLSNPLESTQTIPSSTTITQVFDQAQGELLILGEPGVGKTTLLLELTRDLLKRAKDIEATPIPIVLMLVLAIWVIRSENRSMGNNYPANGNRKSPQMTERPCSGNDFILPVIPVEGSRSCWEQLIFTLNSCI